MLKNYFKTAWRSLINNKVYSLLNILGLAIGMTVALLIGLWVYDQYSWDSFLPGREQAYQVKYNINNKGDIRTQPDVCLPLGDALKKDIPEIAHVAPMFGSASNMLKVGDKKLYLTRLIIGDEFLDIFGFPMLKGNPHLALKELNSIVLTETSAKALFGNTDVMGKTVRMETDNLKVTGILKDIPRNSSFRFDYLTSFNAFVTAGWGKDALTNWNQDFFTLYIALKPNASYAQVEPKARMLVKKYAPPIYNTSRKQITMQPMKDWRLYTDYKNGVAAGGLIDYIRMFSITGVLVLIIACINFMNLSTARSEKRAREVGVRKVIGSSRKGLILQFLMESIILTFAAFLLSLALLQFVLPAFNTLTKADIHLPYSNGIFWLIMVSYVLVTGLLAGSRPAFYLSSFQPAKVLKGTIQTGKAASLSRKVLVILQFTCSIALIIGTIIVYQQIDYARNRPIGYDPNRLLTTDAAYYNYPALKHDLLQSGVVSSITKSTEQITGLTIHYTIDDWQGRLPNEPLSLTMNAVCDTDYFKTLGMRPVAGKNFTGNYAADSLNVILNEAAVKRMRFMEPLNQIISWSNPNAPNHLRVIGVVNDALTNSPFSPTVPTMFVYQPDWTFSLTYRLAPTVNTQAALEKIKTIFNKYDPNIPYSYHFVSDNYAAKFDLEMLMGRLAGIFATLAVFISCLGLFGLAAYMAEQRTKEIGIRKVLGASVSQVLLLLSKDFMILVVISCIIASPVAFYFLHEWLQNYYYRISIGPGVFIVSALTAMLITAVTISFQAVKAALMNPVRSLRSE